MEVKRCALGRSLPTCLGCYLISCLFAHFSEAVLYGSILGDDFTGRDHFGENTSARQKRSWVYFDVSKTVWCRLAVPKLARINCRNCACFIVGVPNEAVRGTVQGDTISDPIYVFVLKLQHKKRSKDKRKRGRRRIAFNQSLDSQAAVLY